MTAPSTDVSKLTPAVLHARYARKIRRQVCRMLGPDDEHDDIVQDVLIVVFRKIDTLRDPACLDGWVAQITSNTLKCIMRRRTLRRHTSWEALPERQLPSSQPDLPARELASRAIEVMHRLPAKERILLSTYWFTPATAGAIAAKTGSSVITVRRKLFKAKSRFEKLARRDPALAGCMTDARRRGRRPNVAPSWV